MLVNHAKSASSKSSLLLVSRRFSTMLLKPQQIRGFHSDHVDDLRPWEKRVVTLIPGDGIGPELCDSVKAVFQAADVPVTWEEYPDIIVDKGVKPQVCTLLLDSLKRTKVCLKGPLSMSDQAGGKSINKLLTSELQLFARVIPVKSLPWVTSRHRDVNLVVIRENTEGEYSGLEHEATPGVVESLKIITRTASMRIAEFAFDFAYRNNRRKVTAVHKANIMKLSDGLFLDCCNQVAKRYPGIEYSGMIVDNTTMQMVSRPSQFDVLVTPNLYGSIVTNIAAGLAGSPGLVGGAIVGANAAIFEQGARHVARDIAGQHKANPTGMIMASVMMLRYLGLNSYAHKINNALSTVSKGGKVATADVGGTATIEDFTDAIVAKLKSN